MTQMSELSKNLRVDEIIIVTGKSFSKLKRLHMDQCNLLEKLQLVGGGALKGLSYLFMGSCASLKHIIGLEHLQCLRDLRIENCGKLEGELIKSNKGIGASPIICFPCLETISLQLLPQVTIICSDNVSFPSLLDLHINECCKLEKFPRCLMNKEKPPQSFRCVIIGNKKWWEGCSGKM